MTPWQQWCLPANLAAVAGAGGGVHPSIVCYAPASSTCHCTAPPAARGLQCCHRFTSITPMPQPPHVPAVHDAPIFPPCLIARHHVSNSAHTRVHTMFSCSGGSQAGDKIVLPLDDNERLLGLQMALKCADIGHVTAALPTHIRWVAAHELYVTHIHAHGTPTRTHTQIHTHTHIQLGVTAGGGVLLAGRC